MKHWYSSAVAACFTVAVVLSSGLNGLVASETSPLVRTPARIAPGRPHPHMLASRLGRPYHVITPMMAHTVHWIQHYNPQVVQPDAEHYVTTIWQVSKEHHVDPLLIVSLVAQESAFRPDATSRVGAQGLGQLMPETASELKVDDPYDADDNLGGCIKLVRSNLCFFNGQVKNAVAAYNAGPGAVVHYHGIPPYRETRNYVHQILRNYSSLRKEVYSNVTPSG